MLSINSIGSNQTELHIDDLTVLFSYSTPVAYCIDGKGYFKVDEFYSVTTSKHINKWLDGRKFTLVTYDSLRQLINSYGSGSQVQL